MSYSEPLSNQIYRFILALGFGIILGVLYEFIALLRSLSGNKKAFVMAGDIIFSVISAFLTFLFMLIYNEGEVRLNLIVSSVIGFLSFHYTFGGRIINPIRKLLLKLQIRSRYKNKNE